MSSSGRVGKGSLWALEGADAAMAWSMPEAVSLDGVVTWEVAKGDIL